MDVKNNEDSSVVGADPISSGKSSESGDGVASRNKHETNPLENGSSTAKDTESLEHRYTRLLELRIAQLEGLVSKSHDDGQSTAGAERTESCIDDQKESSSDKDSAQNEAKSDEAKVEVADKKSPHPRVRNIVARDEDGTTLDDEDIEPIKDTPKLKAADNAKDLANASERSDIDRKAAKSLKDKFEPTIFRRII
ncbi:hypothetical protein TI39_contig5847g00010 [Zymoseptoria brevis]|uniref:Uncharacterized protein n=1 Tax=Zymoseptoria brevis TaxID=1047168 RepID=A0A0F4G635_9PEZI|nr:hypothetical protein TI39_contig5847g00010 [Zymoseptoria brevis]